MVTIGAVIPIVLLVQSGFKLVGLVLSSLGLITSPNVVFCLSFNIFGLFMFSLVAIGFAVDAIVSCLDFLTGAPASLVGCRC